MNCVEIDKSIFSGISESYVLGEKDTEKFFDYSFLSDDSVFEKRDDINSSYDEGLRGFVADILREQAYDFGSSKLSLDSIESFKNNSSMTVVTGQQAGVFLGPLYTVYKAVTAIKLARKYAAILNKPVIPVFWIAAEDHDFEEIRELNYYTKDGIQRAKVTKSFNESNHNSKCIHNFKMLKEQASKTNARESTIDISNSIRKDLEELYPKDKVDKIFDGILICDLVENPLLSMSGHFAKVMAKLFKETELVIFDPSDAKIRNLEKDFFKKAIIKSSSILENVIDMQNQKKKYGYEPSINSRLKTTNIFMDEFGERLAIRLADDWESRHVYRIEGLLGSKEFSQNELIKLIDAEPERFSTGVVLRPVIQDIIFPNLAYVAGPGEINYFAELKKVFGVYDIKMPIVYPRENFTIASPYIRDIIRESHISPASILNTDKDELIKSILLEKSSVDIESIFDEFEGQIINSYKEIIKKISAIDRDIVGIAHQSKDRVRHQVEYLRKKAHRFNRKKYRDVVNKIEDSFSLLKPFDSKQERVLSLVNFLIETDGQFIDKLLKIKEINHTHRLLEI